MRKSLFFLLLVWCPLLFAQEGGVLPEPEASPGDIIGDTLEAIPEAIPGDSSEASPEAIPGDSPEAILEEISVVPLTTVVREAEQEQEPVMVKYSPDFEFKDGIFANFESVKRNDPIPPARIVTDEDLFDRDFYEKITQLKEMVIYDANGVKKVLKTEDIWGYSRNGILHINVGSAFHRISFMGSICHFVATVTTYNPNYYDPYSYNPYYSNSYYYNRYSMPQSTVAHSDLRQYLLDFETGDIMEYDVESVEVLLMKDPELADEYQSLRNRKKKQMKFVYIRLFNEKHPLYFPAD
jgi:hypothetical protein